MTATLLSPFAPFATEADIPPRRISPTMLSTADTCMARIPYYLDRSRPRVSSALRIAGQGYHSGMARAYGTVQTTGAWPTLDQIVESAFLGIDQEIDMANSTNEHGKQGRIDWRFQPKTMRQEEIVWSLDIIRDTVRDALVAYFEGGYFWDVTPGGRYQIIAVEQKFTLPLPGVEGWGRSGVLDLAVRDTELGWDIIVDHKFTKKRWAKDKSSASGNPQPALYTSAWADVTGAKAITVVFDTMSIKDGFERIEAARTQAQIDLTVEKGRMLARLIDQGGPFLPNTSSFLCSETYCDYWTDCPYGRTLK